MDRLSQACVARRTLTGVISHLLPFQQTPSPICSLLRTDVSHHNGAGCREWQHPLPKMTKKLPDTWAWPHLELGAPGLEHCGHPWLGIQQFSSCTLGHLCASFTSPLSPHTLDLINAATINLKLGKGLKGHKAPHCSFRICDCLLSA